MLLMQSDGGRPQKLDAAVARTASGRANDAEKMLGADARRRPSRG